MSSVTNKVNLSLQIAGAVPRLQLVTAVTEPTPEALAVAGCRYLLLHMLL